MEPALGSQGLGAYFKSLKIENLGRIPSTWNPARVSFLETKNPVWVPFLGTREPIMTCLKMKEKVQRTSTDVPLLVFFTFLHCSLSFPYNQTHRKKMHIRLHLLI